MKAMKTTVGFMIILFMGSTALFVWEKSHSKKLEVTVQQLQGEKEQLEEQLQIEAARTTRCEAERLLCLEEIKNSQ